MTPEKKRDAQILKLARTILYGVPAGAEGFDDPRTMVVETLYVAMVEAIAQDLAHRHRTGRGLAGFPLIVRGDFRAGTAIELAVSVEVVPDDEP